MQRLRAAAGGSSAALLAIPAGLLALLAVTNRWMSWWTAYYQLKAWDEGNYRLMALAAPSLPSQKFPEQHAQRFAPQYVVGLIANALGSDPIPVYRVVAILLAVTVCVLLHAALRRIGVAAPAYAVCIALFVLNPYSLRLYIITPGYLDDLAFVAALLLAMLGLIERRLWLVFLGVVLGTLCRQTMLPAAIGLAGWAAFGGGWRAAPRQTRWVRAAAVMLASAAAYTAVALISRRFSSGGTPSLSQWTLLGNLEHLPHGAGALAKHLLKAGNSLLAVGLALAAALLARARAGAAQRLPAEFWAAVLTGAMIAGQPLVFSPHFEGGNEVRLATLSLVAFVTATAIVLAQLERHDAAVSAPAAVAIVAILAIGSLHHIYTWLGPSTASQTFALQIVTGVAVAYVVISGFTRVSSRLAEGDPRRRSPQRHS